MGGRSNGSFSDRTYAQPQPRMFDNNMSAPQMMSSGMQGSWQVPPQFAGQPALNTGMAQPTQYPSFNFGNQNQANQLAVLQQAPTAQNYGNGGLLGMPQQPQIPSMNPNARVGSMCG